MIAMKFKKIKFTKSVPNPAHPYYLWHIFIRNFCQIFHSPYNVRRFLKTLSFLFGCLNQISWKFLRQRNNFNTLLNAFFLVTVTPSIWEDSERKKKRDSSFFIKHFLSLISIPCMSVSGFGRSCCIAPKRQINLVDRKSFMKSLLKFPNDPRKKKMKTTAHKKANQKISTFNLFFCIPHFSLFSPFPLESCKEVSNK